MIGYKSVLDGDLHWRKNQGALFPLSPPGRLSGFDDQAAKQLLKSTGAVLIRWESAFDQDAKSDWWHVIKDEESALSELSSNTRSKVRRGLKAFECGPISRDDVMKEGPEVYCRAFARYQTHELQYSAADFLEAIKDLPEHTEFWGVRSKNSKRLVAFSENYVEGNACFFNTIWFEPSALRKYSSYALFYEMTHHYLKRRNLSYVSDGARSLSHNTQIHDFLESKFGFRKAYARLHVVYTPWLDFAIACAYPLRSWINKVSLGPFKKASILLRQEEIRRSCLKVAK